MSISIDQPVPPTSLPATGGRTLSTADFLGKPLVLYFYPKDNTPGCTQEGQDFRDLYPQFQAAGGDIVGVSRDGVKTHENFVAKHAFPFALLSDKDETLCRQFDVLKEKKMFGKPVMGIERSTFLINAQGVVRAEWRKVKVPGHAQEVLERLQQL